MESAEEFLDFETIVQVPPEKLRDKLNAQLPEGLRFKSLKIIDRKTESLFQVIDAADYRVSLSGEAFNHTLKQRVNGRFNGNLADMHVSLVDDLLNRESIEITKTSKGRTRVQDIKPLIKHLKVANTEAPLHLRMRVATGSSGNVRPDIILRELYGDLADQLEIRRERLLVEQSGEFVSPLEIA